MRISFDQPFPTREEQYALAVKARAGDDAAFSVLVESHLPLVVRIAWRYPNLIPYEDRFQAGAGGLCAAARKFDPETGNLLASYADRAIHNRIRDEIRKQLGLTELDEAKWVLIKRASNRIWIEENREPDPEELAAEGGCTVPEVEHLARCHNAGFMFLEASDPAPADVEDLSAPPERQPDHEAAQNEVVGLLRAYLRKLPEAERRAVELYYGLAGEEKHTLAETGALMNTTEWQATRLKNQGVYRLQRLMLFPSEGL